MKKNLTLIGAALVVLVTLTVSSVHLYTVSMAANAGWLSFLTPVAVDGLGLVAAVSLWDARKNHLPVSTVAVSAMALSLLASGLGNILYPFVDSLNADALRVLSAIVAVYPAVALAVSIELVLSAIREESSEDDTEAERIVTTEVTEVIESVSPDTPEMSPVDTLRRLMMENPDATSAELAAGVGRSASWVRAKRSVIRQELVSA